MSSVETSKVKLYNGVEMPYLGLGVYRAAAGDEVENAIKFALQVGYRSFDTASYYQNEHSVGKAIAESGVARTEIFLTSKIWNNDQGYHSTQKAFQLSLEKLQTDYLDLYLIHWPVDQRTFETWQAMEELYERGLIRAIGVSNFSVHNLKRLKDQSKIRPMINQYEFHPELIQPELLRYCQENHIQTEAHRPIMRGKVNEIPLLQTLSLKYQKSPVQIVLRWNLQKGMVTIPKSVSADRIRHNAEIFDFDISGEDMIRIDGLDKSSALGENINFVIL